MSTTKMLSKLREICCCSKERIKDDDTQDTSRPVYLSKTEKRTSPSRSAQRHDMDRSEVALIAKADKSVDTTAPLDAKYHKSEQQDRAKLIQPAGHDEPGIGEFFISKQTEESRPFDNGTKDSNEVQDGDSKEPADKTSNLPKLKPADGEVINRSSSPDQKDLWQMAFDELSDDLKTSLRASEAKSPESAIQKVIDRTKETFQEYQNAALKIKKYNGKEINVRDVAEKILNSAIHCSEIVKAVAAFDPSGHAGNAWGAVLFGLTMTKNNMEQKKAVFQSSGFLAEILARYTILDHYCRIQGLPSSDGLDSAIVQVYKALLEYSAEIEKRQDAGKLDRMVNSIFSVSETDLSRLQSIVEEQNRKVSNWSQITHVLHQSTKAAEILAGIESLGQDTQIIKVKVLEGERQRILDWLSNVNFSKFQNDYKILRTKRTGDWLLGSSEYGDWKATPGKFLWLHGPAGCGKSVLCSTVVRDIEETRSVESTVSFSYWYFQHDNKETQDVQAMTRAIIRQLVTQELPKSLVSLWKEHTEHNREPDQDKFLAVLGDVIDCHTRDDLFLIFDALDECPERKPRERDSLFEILKYLRDKPGKKIHLLATSRFEEGISRHMTGSLRIDLEQRMQDDVETFVCDALINGPLNYWKDVHVEIKEVLLSSKERRRFRWADLQLKSLEDCKKKEEILELLGSVPETLEETYRGILEKIHGHKRKNEWKDARSILTWLSFSLQPLSLKAVAAAVGYERPEDVVSTCTTSLVTVSPSDGTIKLAHFSVKEFLVGSDGVQDRDWYQLTAVDSHFDIANCALDALLKETKALDRESVDERPLFQYAAEYWYDHFSELVGSGCRLLELEDKMASLFQRPIVYLNWQRFLRNSFHMTLWDTTNKYLKVIAPPLYVACQMGLQSVVERLLSQGADPFASSYDSRYYNYSHVDAFDAAALEDHLTILKHLLGTFNISAEKAQTIMETIDLTDASPNDIGVFLDILLRPGLSYDVSANEWRVLKEDFVIAIAKNWYSSHLLMGFLLNMQGGPEIPVTQRCLEELAWNLVSGEKTLRVLCDKRPEDIKITQKIVHEIVKHQPVKTLELLSKLPDVDIKVTEELLVAAASNLEGAGTLGWLLERAPPIKVTSTILRSVVRSNDRKEKMDILFTKCQEAFSLGKDVLQDVATGYDVDLMRMLLQKREEALTFFDLSDTILTVIASRLHCIEEMMSLLVDNTNSSVSVSEEILCSVARSEGHGASVTKWLLTRDRSVSITEKVLVSAVGNRFQGKDVMKFLLTRDRSVSITEKVWTSAVRNDKQGESIVRYLLEIDKTRPITEEILSSAVHNESQGASILRCLLGHGKKLEITENVLISAAGNRFQAEQLLGCIFNKFPDVAVTHRVLMTVVSDMAISVLLRHSRNHGQDYSVRIVEYAASRPDRIVKLLQKGLIEVDNDLVAAMGTQEVLRAALEDIHLMTKLLDLQENNIAVTEEAILEVLNMEQMDIFDMDRADVDYEAFKLLCDRHGLTELDTTKILRVALLNRQYKFSGAFLDERGHENIQELWNSIFQAEGCTPFDIVRSARVLLRYGDFDVFPALWRALTMEGSYSLNLELAKLCTAQNLSAPAKEIITEIVVERADAQALHEMFINLLESGIFISKRAWDAIWRNHELSLAQKVEASEFLLCYGEFDVSQTLLQFLPLEEAKENFTDEEVNQLFNLCAGREISLPATETLAKLVFGQGNAYTIQRFIRHNPTVQLTDELLQFVQRNEYADKDLLMSFFRSKGVTIASIGTGVDGAVSEVTDEI
ncbi:hypothetical protein BDW69DRAFT_29203 [Aspergillus filifer]